MILHDGIENIKPIPGAVVTIGNFDGVHLGHQKIFNRVKHHAREVKGQTVLLTLWPHPRIILNPGDKNLKLLSTFDEKATLIEQQGIDHLVKIPFDQDFSELSAEQFVQDILVNKIGAKKIVIGYDHHFGKNREGDFNYLQDNAERFGFEVEEIPREDIDDIAVSSSRIRKAISAGRVNEANELLCREYSLTGQVVGGEKLGRKLGYPTANIEVDNPYKLVPADGIYAVRVNYNGVLYQGMLSIGNRPTVNGKSRTIEVNIFGFDNEIYGETLTLYFIKYIRSEEKFSSVDELVAQMHQDKKATLEILSHY